MHVQVISAPVSESVSGGEGDVQEAPEFDLSRYEGSSESGPEAERTPGFSVLVRQLESERDAAGFMWGR